MGRVSELCVPLVHQVEEIKTFGRRLSGGLSAGQGAGE